MSALQPDLSEARRLHGIGLQLVKMIDFTKQPAGNEWNKHPVERIDPDATGYGVILAPNKLCSIDPDHINLARIGVQGCGFDLEAWMAAGVRTRSTRKDSGGRSAFAADGEIGWVKFKCERFGTILELRAEAANLQDTIPGIVYRDKAGNLCTQQYANCKRLDDAPGLPDDLLAWWERLSTDLAFRHAEEKKFFTAIATALGLTLADLNYSPATSTTSKGKVTLAFSAPGHRQAYNAAHTVEEHLERHGYTWHPRLKRWSHAGATGSPGIYPVPGKDGQLWRSDHGGDPLSGAFDAWSAFVILDHRGDVEAAKRAVEAEGLVPPSGFFSDLGNGPDDAGGHVTHDEEHFHQGEQPRDDEAHDEGTTEAPKPHKFDPRAAGLRADLFTVPPPAPQFIIDRILPADVGVRAAAGGTAKTTLELYEAIHVILGRELYGFPILKPGPVVIVTAEDEKVRLEWRLVQIVDAMQLTDDERAEVIAKLHIEDLSDRPRRLVDLWPQSQSLFITRVVDEFIESYGKVQPVLTVFDPQTYFGPGERFVNDGEALVMSAGRRIAKAWGGAVRFDHHTGKVQFREGKVDMYAGRGGSAGADNARYVHVVVPHEKDDEHYKAPVSVLPEDIAGRRLLRLHVPKVSHGAPVTEPIWLLRKEWSFRRIIPTRLDPEVMQRDELRNLWHFLRYQNDDGIRHTRSSLEDNLGALGLTRARLRALLHVGLQKKHFIEVPLISTEKKGARTHYITTGTEP